MVNHFFSFQDKIAAGLKELRNKAVFFFSMFNALFVLIVFMLTLHKDTLYINWPFGVKENITYTEDEHVRNCRLVLESKYNTFNYNICNIIQILTFNFILDSGHKRIPSLGTDWYRPSLLLFPHHRHSVRRYVVPSLRYLVTYISINRTQLPQERSCNRRSFDREECSCYCKGN